MQTARSDNVQRVSGNLRFVRLLTHQNQSHPKQYCRVDYGIFNAKTYIRHMNPQNSMKVANSSSSLKCVPKKKEINRPKTGKTANTGKFKDALFRAQKKKTANMKEHLRMMFMCKGERVQ
jgi:hypothetical protein